MNTITPDQMLNKSEETEAKATPTTARVIKPAVQVEKAKVNNDSIGLTQLNSLISTWEKAWENDNKRVISKTFKSMIDHVLKYQDDKSVMDAWRKLFIKYRTTYLAPDKAMVGIYNMTEAESNKMAIAYTLMSELVNPDRTRKDYDIQYAASVLNNPKCRVPNGYVAYIAERMR